MILSSVYANSEASDMKNSNQIVLENEKIRIRKVQLYPNDKTPGIHKHKYPYVAVIIKAGKVRVIDINKKTTKKDFKKGEAIYVPTLVEHEVINIDSHPIEIIEVDIK